MTAHMHLSFLELQRRARCRFCPGGPAWQSSTVLAGSKLLSDRGVSQIIGNRYKKGDYVGSEGMGQGQCEDTMNQSSGRFCGTPEKEPNVQMGDLYIQSSRMLAGSGRCKMA